LRLDPLQDARIETWARLDILGRGRGPPLPQNGGLLTHGRDRVAAFFTFS
jgi:hypothetical protein